MNKKISNFKLVSIEEDNNNYKIHGICLNNESDLNKYLNSLEEAKLRDHRRLGKELELFTFDINTPGMPYLLPNGLCVYNALIDKWRCELNDYDYKEFSSPLLSLPIFEYNKTDSFILENASNAGLLLKMDNYPNSIFIYKNKLHSYKELPVRLSSISNIHRNESASSLHGLLRTRYFHQDNLYSFMDPEGVEDEINRILDLIDHIYSNYDLVVTPYLSTRPKNYVGDIEKWNEAEATLEKILNSRFKKKWVLNSGAGEFYGPKIAFMVEDSVGRKWQLGTIVLDYQLPNNFDLTYVDSDKSKKRPVMIHSTIYGSIERFIGILLEQYKGVLPLSITPVQIVIIPVNNKYHLDCANDIYESLKRMKYRVELDDRSEKLGYKLRESVLRKIPYTIIIGQKEVDDHKISYRRYGNENTSTVSLDTFTMFFTVAKGIN